MRISDWSSDVCSSDLIQCRLMVEGNPSKAPFRVFGSSSGIVERAGAHPFQAEALHINIRVGDFRIVTEATGLRQQRSEERREGKRVSVRVDLGGRRIIKKKLNTIIHVPK